MPTAVAAIAHGVHSADVVLNILARQREHAIGQHHDAGGADLAVAAMWSYGIFRPRMIEIN